MAIVDANYNFIYAHAGTQGRISDGGVYRATAFGRMMSSGNLKLPDDEELPSRQVKVPYVIVADDAFALSRNIMKPYAGHQDIGSKERIFNYRLSRARRIVENAFGILAQVFRILRKPILLSPEKVEIIILTVVTLHNFLRRDRSRTYCPPGNIDVEDNGNIHPGSWRNDTPMSGMQSLQRFPQNSPREAKAIREEFADYFVSSIGQVPWQWDM